MVNTYTVLDIETTGISAAHAAEVLEVAAYHTDGITIGDSFHEYIKPWAKIPKRTVEINHITEDMVKDKLNKFVVLPKLREFIGDSIVVAHNATFDFNFLNIEFFRIGQPLMDKYICTQKNFKKMFPGESTNLTRVSEILNIPLTNAHCALDDTKATVEVFIKLMSMRELDTVSFTKKENLINTLSRIVKGSPHKSQTEIMTAIPYSECSDMLSDEEIIRKFSEGLTPNEICVSCGNNYKEVSLKFIQWINMIRYAKFIRVINDKKIKSEVLAMIDVSDSFSDLLELHRKIYGFSDANLTVYGLMWAVLKNKENMKYEYGDFEWHFKNRKTIQGISTDFSISPFMVADNFVKFAQDNKEEYRDYITANLCSVKELRNVIRGEDFVNVLSSNPSALDIKKYIAKKLYALDFFKITFE